MNVRWSLYTSQFDTAPRHPLSWSFGHAGTGAGGSGADFVHTLYAPNIVCRTRQSLSVLYITSADSTIVSLLPETGARNEYGHRGVRRDTMANRGQIKGATHAEANMAAKSTKTTQDTRLPQTNAHTRRSQCTQTPSSTGPQQHRRHRKPPQVDQGLSQAFTRLCLPSEATIPST